MPSNSPEMPRRVLVLLRREVLAVRVAEGREHALDRALDRRLLVDLAAGVALGDGPIRIPERLERLGLTGRGAEGGRSLPTQRVARQERPEPASSATMTIAIDSGRTNRLCVGAGLIVRGVSSGASGDVTGAVDRSGSGVPWAGGWGSEDIISLVTALGGAQGYIAPSRCYAGSGAMDPSVQGTSPDLRLGPSTGWPQRSR